MSVDKVAGDFKRTETMVLFWLFVFQQTALTSFFLLVGECIVLPLAWGSYVGKMSDTVVGSALRHGG